jgi:DNA-3-methyladenine glycosylase
MTADTLRAAFARPTLEVARSMLGMRLVGDGVAGRIVGRIVEVEAYLGPADRASHARSGETMRNRPMYGDPGRAYVYLVYGMYHCLNVVTEPAGTPHAVLIRAVEPLEGIGLIRAARLRAERLRRRSIGPAELDRVRVRLERTPDQRLAAGPGLVGAAFGLDRALSGSDLLDPANPIHLEAAPADDLAFSVVTSARVGIAYAGQPWTSEPWRFAIADHPSVSR